MIPIRVHSFSTRCISWEEKTMVVPPARPVGGDYGLGRDGVDALERFIEEQDRGPMDDGRAEGDLLPHPAGVVAYDSCRRDQVEHSSSSLRRLRLCRSRPCIAAVKSRSSAPVSRS